MEGITVINVADYSSDLLMEGITVINVADYSVTNLGWVRGQDHTNNEQTQSVEGII